MWRRDLRLNITGDSCLTMVKFDDQRKRIKKYGFSNENEFGQVKTKTKMLMWSKIFCFLLVQTKTDTSLVRPSELMLCFRVYLGVRTCELFLCFVAIVRVRAIMLTSLFCLFYVTGEFHRFLHRGRALFSSSRRCPLDTGLTYFELRGRLTDKLHESFLEWLKPCLTPAGTQNKAWFKGLMCCVNRSHKENNDRRQ